MLKVDDVEHGYTKAINVFNFDKLGHPDGSGSWGILFSIHDSFVDVLHVYIGLKFDVISVSSSRFVATWFNMEKKHKELVGSIRQRTEMDLSQRSVSDYDISTADEDHFYEFYLDIHKIEIDVIELAKTIYQKTASINEYSFIAKHRAFNIKTERSARAISAKMMRIYEGNLETFSHIFTDSDRNWMINGLMLEDNLVSDEIKYTIWLTPHDLEESLFYESGDIAYETGDEYIEGLGEGHVLGDIMTSLFTADRRGLRNGYMDISAEDPMVNHGYRNAEVSMFDTYLWGVQEVSMTHRHKSIVSIDASYYNHCPQRLSPLTIYPGDIITSIIDTIQNNLIKIKIIESLVGNRGERGAVISGLIQNCFIDDILEAVGLPSKISKSNIYIQQCRDYLEDTLVVPLCIHNVLFDLTSLDAADIQDSVVIMYHPVLDKNVFFDVAIGDIVELTSSSLIFRIDGLEYGYSIKGKHGNFYWAGIIKPFRYNDNIWINLKGIVMQKGVIPSVSLNFTDAEALSQTTDSKIPIFEDLEYDSKYGRIIAVRKNDFIDIIKKRVGAVSSDYIFGIPGGNINISGGSMWM